MNNDFCCHSRCDLPITFIVNSPHSCPKKSLSTVTPALFFISLTILIVCKQHKITSYDIVDGSYEARTTAIINNPTTVLQTIRTRYFLIHNDGRWNCYSEALETICGKWPLTYATEDRLVRSNFSLITALPDMGLHSHSCHVQLQWHCDGW